MIIRRIQIRNFGPFSGNHEFTLSEDGPGVHLVRGGNGQGKTSIQRAVLWCLYGKVLDRKGNEVRPTSLLNWAAKDDDIYQYWVRIHFIHEGKPWSISRGSQARTHSDQGYRNGTTLDVVEDGVPVPNPGQAIERILPYEVHRFFFFDGEMLRDYEELLEQSSSSMTRLRNSIEQVLGIPYLRIARDDLLQVQKKIERERAKLVRRLGGEDYDRLVDDMEAITEEIERRGEQIIRIQKQIEDIDSESTGIKRRMADIESISKLAGDRLEVERRIMNLEKEKDKELERVRALTSEYYKTLLAQPASDIMDGLEERHKEVMGKYNKKQECLAEARKLEQAIARSKCEFCGTVLNAKEVARLEPRLKEVRIKIDELTEIPEPNLEFESHKNRLNLMIVQAPSRNSFDEIERRLAEIDHRLASEESRLATIKEGLEGVDDEEPHRLNIKLRELGEERGRLTGLIEAELSRLKEDRETKSELDKMVSSINQEELETLAERIELVASLAEVLEEAIDVYRNERRTDVETAATSIFQHIRSKKDFAKLAINEQFGLNILTTEGQVLDRAEWRSAGEEQIVALALIGALNQCAQVEAPIFMDTPFGRLDTKHGERVLRFLPNLADQVVLLATDREFRKGDERFLEGKIKTDHTVTYKGEKIGSSIRQTRDVGGA